MAIKFKATAKAELELGLGFAIGGQLASTCT